MVQDFRMGRRSEAAQSHFRRFSGVRAMNMFGKNELNASVELLAFMWVKAGRNPAAFTSESVILLRLHLLQMFANLPPDTQYALTNAKAIHEELKNAWSQVPLEQLKPMAWQFGQFLDSLGLQDPEARWDPWTAASGAEPNASEANGDLAGLAQTTAWNLAQKSSGGW
jgi:hypothetical protein